MRIGMGYDVHRLTEGRDLILGGVKIPYEKGLLGHSDADVLLHAVMDALLGAAALGDIGQHFPDTDEAYRGISSLELLKRVGELLEEHLFWIGNIDATVIAQRPKLAPYREQMRKKHRGGASDSCQPGQREGDDRGGTGVYRHGRGHCYPCRGSSGDGGEFSL